MEDNLSLIEVSADSSELRLSYQSGALYQLSAATLRNSARDSVTRREKIDQGRITIHDDLCITEVLQVGSVGLNIQFSDGHQRGLYPYDYLLEIALQHGNKQSN